MSNAQMPLTSEEAFKRYEEITAVMEADFPENEYRTFRRESFSETQLQTYLSQHFQRMELLKFIDNHHYFKLRSYQHSGNWFMQLRFPKESIKWYRKFFDYYTQYRSELTDLETQALFELITHSYSVQAENYAKIGLLDSAKIQHKLNLKFIEPHNVIAKPSAYNNYGLYFYWNKHELDSALVNFNKAYYFTQKHFPNHTLLGSIRDNIADIYFETKKYNKALQFYSENLDFYNYAINEKSLTKDIPRLLSSGSQKAETLLKLNRAKEAQKVINVLQPIVDDTINAPSIRRSSSHLEFLTAKSNLYVLQQSYRKAYETLDTILKLSAINHNVTLNSENKWREELNTIAIDRVELQAEIDRIEKENKIESQRSKLWFITLLSTTFVIVLLSLFLSRRQHLINAKNKQLLAEQQLENSDLKMKQLNSEIKSKKRDLSDFAINLTQNQEWAKTLADKINDFKSANKQDSAKLLEALELQIQNKVKFDSETKEFYERLDKLSDGFYSELNSRFPNLSKNEIRLCSLIRLKIDSRSIATLQNITLASLNTSRYRLRKKLHLNEATELDDFIQNM
ncbi:tetratricopeptide repeat protein [Winogradskyella forsetii]|uniref:tetratricopeptide repeat protein n=1 Tax=Winogradskyella forsetii TaxID=2686077 RepID=UPI0015BB52BD|nr:tetratricopeptide repeat protein [Winogradskyella forsetii]